MSFWGNLIKKFANEISPVGVVAKAKPTPTVAKNKDRFAGQPLIKINKVHKDFLREWRIEYLDQLAPPEIFNMGFMIAGGCLRNMVRRNEPIADVDCFYLKQEVNQGRVLQDVVKIIGHDLLRMQTISPSAVNAWGVVALSGGANDPSVWEGPYNDHKLQIIFPKVTFDLTNLLGRFDFCAVQWAYDGDYLYYTDQAVIDCVEKNITINYVKRKHRTLARLEKYRGKGYNVSEDVFNLVLNMPERAGENDDYFV